MVQYLLDTDICSYVIRNRPAAVRARMKAVPLAEQAISSVTYAELMHGVARSSQPAKNREIVAAFISHLAILAWDANAAEHYADIRTRLDEAGTPIGAMEMMIAAHARSLAVTIVTNNLRHFDKVPRLRVENWA